MIAEQTRLMGEPVKSWQHLRRALALLPRMRRLPRIQAVLITAAHTSLGQRLPEASSYYQQAFIEAAQKSKVPIGGGSGLSTPCKDLFGDG